MSALFTATSELRSGWKFAIFAIVLVIFFLIPGLLAALFIPGDFLIQHQFGINVAIQLLAGVAATLFMARFVDHQPLSTYGISLHKGWLRDFAVGMVIAAGMLLVMVAACVVLGNIEMFWNGLSMLSALLALTAILLGAAAFEEIVFRGYPLQALMKGIGAWPAAILMSILFGIVHAGNPNASRLGIINTILAGGVLSAAYLKTRSLWFPYGIHLAWNAGLGLVLGFSLSGLNIASLWTTNVKGQEILTGGGYGPEGGIVGTIAFVTGVGLVGFYKNRNNNQETS